MIKKYGVLRMHVKFHRMEKLFKDINKKIKEYEKE